MRRISALFLALAALLAGCSTGDDESRPPQLGVKAEDEQAAEKLGFPSTATRNTIRVGGSDAVADAAGVAGALYPATGDSDRPTAVVLVDQDDWATAIAASVLVGPPDRRADPAHGRRRHARRVAGRAGPAEARRDRTSRRTLR